MTEEELQTLLRYSPTFKSRLSRLWEAGDDLILGTGSLSLVIAAVWFLLAWVVRLSTDLDIGWGSQHRETALIVITIGSFVTFAFILSGGGALSGVDQQAVSQDLEGRLATVSEYKITEVAALEEPEHGAYFFFLRTSDDRVYATFDFGSKEVAIAGANSSQSQFVPKSRLLLSRAKKSGVLVGEEFRGEALAFEVVGLMTSETEHWPQTGEFLDIPWMKIERTFRA